jgi:hypothetical protein
MEANRRSDLVRARRNQRSSTSSKPRKDRKRKKSSPRSMPPVFSRAGFAYPTTTSTSVKAPAKARRKYNLSLDSAGAEVKLPAVPVVSIGWRVLSGMMTVGLLFALYWLWTAPMFTVAEVTLNGIARVDAGDLLARANVIGQPVFAIDPQELQGNLQESVRALEEITVMVNYPAEVIFEAVERLPVIVWEQAGVTSWWVDINGVRFAPLGTSEDLIYVEAKAPPPQIFTPPQQGTPGKDGATTEKPANEQLLLPEMVSGIMFLAEYLPEGARLMYHEQYGIGWEDPEMGWQVFFGKVLDQMPVRIALYQAISTDLIERNRIPQLISIEQVQAPYYRMRN